MHWLWLCTAVVVLTLGPVLGPPGPRGGVRGVEHGRVLQDGGARAGAGVSGRWGRPPRRGTRPARRPCIGRQCSPKPRPCLPLCSPPGPTSRRGPRGGGRPCIWRQRSTKPRPYLPPWSPPGPTPRRGTILGWTPLHFAAQSTKTPAVLVVLLAAGRRPYGAGQGRQDAPACGGRGQ